MDGLYFDTWYDLTTTSNINMGYIFYQNKVKKSNEYHVILSLVLNICWGS